MSLTTPKLYEYSKKQKILEFLEKFRNRASIKKLELNDMEVHHKIPKVLGGKDEYSNLLYVTCNAHKIIHATEMETINKYMKMENLVEKALKKLNLLCKKVGNHIKILPTPIITAVLLKHVDRY